MGEKFLFLKFMASLAAPLFDTIFNTWWCSNHDLDKNIARKHEREKGKVKCSEIKSCQIVYFMAMGEDEFYKKEANTIGK